MSTLPRAICSTSILSSWAASPVWFLVPMVAAVACFTAVGNTFMLPSIDHSRIAFTQILPSFDAACAIAFLRASVAYYASLGIVIRRLLTDNGHCYRSRAFHAAV